MSCLIFIVFCSGSRYFRLDRGGFDSNEYQISRDRRIQIVKYEKGEEIQALRDNST
jgi:hypothetical protein